MPEIGDQLRETRMRNRIDITEVESATKIRAKYLRALENEEWDLLPGTTFVKTFLRTYADYLGLDARVLVEQYRQRYERPPTGQELTPFGTNLGGRRARARRPIVAPWMVVALGAVLLVGALFALGTLTGESDDPGEEAVATATPAPDDAGTAGGEADEDPPARRRRRTSRIASVQIRATGPVSVCLEDARGQPVIRNETLDAGDRSRTFRSRRFLASFGTGAAVMRVNGKSHDVSDDAPVGYEIRRGRAPRRLDEGRRPTCAG